MQIKKSELIDIIEGLTPFSSPKLIYEQYITDAVSTADLIYHIAFTHQDLIGNIVVDLGCGTGNLSIASALMGAIKVISVDIDESALENLSKNINSLNLTHLIYPLQLDLNISNSADKILEICTKYQEINTSAKIIVISNPPFGVKQKGADLMFLRQAFKFAHIIYSIHLSSPKVQLYLQQKINQLGGFITERSNLYLILKHTYSHHKVNQKQIKTDVYRIVKKAI